MNTFNLYALDITKPVIHRNLSVPALYEQALRNEKDCHISDKGALLVFSGDKTGRSPKDRRIVENPASAANIHWGNVNQPIDEQTFTINKNRAIDYFNTRDFIYVVDGFAGWDPRYRLKVRIICTRAYHALFMHNMLIRPSQDELLEFGEPDYTIFNAGAFPVNRFTNMMSSKTSITLNFEKREIVILGTEYAGEMKKAVFTVMNYLMPLKNILPMHCSANIGRKGDVSLFFGLSGTGKTTLSADTNRSLIGDDEHCWTDEGVFNIEGGCYAKVIHLSPEKEPEIFSAIRFGTVLENVDFDHHSRRVDFDQYTITENTRASYPIDYIANAHIPCSANHPSNIIFLTCDAYGVLPPVCKLTPEQASYYFISGYTAKVAGTEMGVTEPSATFSACFGAAFMPWHHNKYAELLSNKIQNHNVQAWMINTGWTGGGYGTGSRISLKYTRAIIDAIHLGAFEQISFRKDKVFGFEIPVSCPDVPSEILTPENTWQDKEAYSQALQKVANLFKQNFSKFSSGVNPEIVAAGPQ